eukprot:SAG31_NODE_1309_length_8877_cov_5.662452_6_plen_124_part_00
MADGGRAEMLTSAAASSGSSKAGALGIAKISGGNSVTKASSIRNSRTAGGKHHKSTTPTYLSQNLGKIATLLEKRLMETEVASAAAGSTVAANDRSTTSKKVDIIVDQLKLTIAEAGLNGLLR